MRTAAYRTVLHDWSRAALLCASLFFFSNSALAQTKAFLLGGTTWQLVDVTSDVSVSFQGLRTNRATGGWNVSVSLSNHGTRDLYTPLVLSIDYFTGTTGPLDADGWDQETPAKPFYNLSAFKSDGLLSPGDSTLPRTLSLGPGRLPSLTTRVFALLPPPEFRITEISFGPDGKALIEHTADTNSYYILLAGDQIAQITLAADMALPSGTNGTGQLRDSVSNSTNAARFYRVRKVPLNRPLDSDGDGIDDVWELTHAAPSESLNPLDPTDASRIGTSGRTLLEEYQAATFPLTKIVESSPANGESGVAVMRETIFRFNQALAASTVLNTNALCATFGGRRILSRIELSTDRKTVTLFYQEPLPASARVRVTFHGTGLTDYLGRALDLDGDDQPGGNAIVDFDTLSITPVAGTGVIGHVFAATPVPVVGTNTTNFINHPLAGVRISVIGAEQDEFTVTDAQGYFSLSPCPAGRFFVTIDGRTSPESQWPNGAYYPVIGKPWEAVAGRTNNLAAGAGLIYLPLVQAGTLQPVNPIADTTITFPSNIVAQNPLLEGVTVTIPANDLYSDNGTRGGMVGMAPVPGDRLPEPLPPMLHHVLDITVQTDGPQNVDRPLPVRFPNLPDPVTGQKLPPGAKSALMSYNHDTGRWEVQGPMTVTADGNYLETDPGVGVRKPGWHGAQPGVQGSGGPITGPAGGSNGGSGSGSGGNGSNGGTTGNGGSSNGNNGSGGGIDTDGDGVPDSQDPDPNNPNIPPPNCANPSVAISVHTSSPVIGKYQLVNFQALGLPYGGEFLWNGGIPLSDTQSRSYTAQFLNYGPDVVGVTYSCPDTGEVSSDNAQITVLEESGLQWVSRYFGSTDPNDLYDPVKSSVLKFLSAVARATDDSASGHPSPPEIYATYRPPERSYLMYNAWAIANGGSPELADSTDPGPAAGVPIIWTHYNSDGSLDDPGAIDAAKKMIGPRSSGGFGLAAMPARFSRHNRHLAIDMTIRWVGTLKIRDAQNNLITIGPNPPHSGTPDGQVGNRDILAVGETYGITNFERVTHPSARHDPVHWSDTGY